MKYLLNLKKNTEFIDQYKLNSSICDPKSEIELRFTFIDEKNILQRKFIIFEIPKFYLSVINLEMEIADHFITFVKEKFPQMRFPKVTKIIIHNPTTIRKYDLEEI